MIGIQDFLNYRSIGDLTVSDDEAYAAYTVIQARLKENDYTRELWLTQIASARSFKLLENGEFTSYFWKGEDLYYLSPAAEGRTQLCQVRRKTGSKSIVCSLPVETREVWTVGDRFFARVPQQLIQQDYPEELSFLQDHAEGFETIDEIPLWDNGRGFISGKRSTIFGFAADGNAVQLTHPHTNVDMVLAESDGLYFTARTYRGRNTEPGIYFLGKEASSPVCLLAEGILFGKSWWLPRLRKCIGKETV